MRSAGNFHNRGKIILTSYYCVHVYIYTHIYIYIYTRILWDMHYFVQSRRLNEKVWSYRPSGITVKLMLCLILYLSFTKFHEFLSVFHMH